ncbi:hypothetical protein M422DRAFT_274738 [Sphaerobolus stellatus SS14]|uniref:Uncharacterized protein n=1 Tax=Sphaerobolus stellatus (strain SS14) TaxID=990650 RepID=A0A0C9UH29_SPHS4|nr:hypothetical protein M422DRAFT_274738 [Sphaerobolus stellatus SS14]
MPIFIKDMSVSSLQEAKQKQSQWLEGFLGEKVLKAFADPRCTVIILMSTCGPLMLTGSQCEECYGLMIKHSIDYIIGTDCASLVPAMIATTMARVLQLISSFKMSPKDAIEEACAQRLLGMYTRVILMTLVPMPGHNNFNVNDIMFSYAAGTVRVHGLSNPICIHCGSNTKEEQHQKKWYFKCLYCKIKTDAVERPEDVTSAGRRPSWDPYPDIWDSDKKEAKPLKNKGKEREATGTTGIPSSLPKVAGDLQAQIRKLEKEIAKLTKENIKKTNMLNLGFGVGQWEAQLQSFIDADEMEVDDHI